MNKKKRVEKYYHDQRWSKKEIEDYFDPAKNDNKRTTVMTGYNSKVYQLDGLTFE